MGNYFRYVVNLDKHERIGIEILGEYHKWSYHFGEHENSLVAEVIAFLCVWRNNSGPRDASGFQGSWAVQRVLFVGDDDGHGWEPCEGGYTSEGFTVDWDPGALYRESRGFKDITIPVMAQLCEFSEGMARRVAEASRTSSRFGDGVLKLVEEILSMPGQRTEELQRQMAIAWGKPVSEIFANP